MAMDQALVQIPEEGTPQLTAAPASGDARGVYHRTGFAGRRLLLLDKVVLMTTGGCYVFLTVFLFLAPAYIWSVTLATLVLLGLCDCGLLRLRGQAIMVLDRTVRRLMYCFPFTFFCFYAQAIIHEEQECPWYISIGSAGLRGLMQVFIYIIGCVAVLSMALAALRLDCNGSPGVSLRTSESRWYTACHVIFRFTEVLSRFGVGVFFCECLRVLPMAQKLAPPFFLCIPFCCLIFLYAVSLQFANQAGGKPLDGILTCIVIGVVTLAMNPTHFLARPGYEAAARNANKFLFIIRFFEAILLGVFLYESQSDEVSCKMKETCWNLIQKLGVPALCTVVVSLTVHCMIMALHSEIQHSTCQALTADAGGAGRVQVTFPRPDEESLYVPPPPADAGLGEAWLQLGGGLPLFSIAERMEPAVMDQYRIKKILGGGSFGVVVLVGAVGGTSYAMKLLNTSGQHNARMARREVDIYSSIWLNMRELAANFSRVGHPNIVRLHFWTDYDEAREFWMRDDDQAEDRLVKHPSSRNTKFHMALMMECCDTNLEKYLAEGHAKTPAWFAMIQHLLAEIISALEFLHTVADIAYRDLKPENVLIVKRPGMSPSVHCKLGDFGYGRQVDQVGTYAVSVAGTPYFCAPEMEDRVEFNAALNANPQEEKALDIYSFGTVGYVLAHGPGYFRDPSARLTGNRVDHPRCQTAGEGRCQACSGCNLLQSLGTSLQQWQVNLALCDCLIHLIGQCVDRRATGRPTTAQIKGSRLFEEQDFDALLRLDI